MLQTNYMDGNIDRINTGVYRQNVQNHWLILYTDNRLVNVVNFFVIDNLLLLLWFLLIFGEKLRNHLL